MFYLFQSMSDDKYELGALWYCQNAHKSFMYKLARTSHIWQFFNQSSWNSPENAHSTMPHRKTTLSKRSLISDTRRICTHRLKAYAHW